MDVFEKIIPFIDKARSLMFGEIVVCSNTNCREWTPKSAARHPNVRKRWIIDQYIGDDDENATVTLCPKCVKEFFHMTEKMYADIERGEKLASGQIEPDAFFAELTGEANDISSR